MEMLDPHLLSLITLSSKIIYVVYKIYSTVMSYIQYMSKYICCICIHLFLIECCSSPIFSAKTLLLQKRSFEVLLPSDTKCRFGCGIASELKSGQLRVGPTFRSPITWACVVESKAVQKGFPFSEAAADGRLSDPFAGVPVLLLL